MSKNKKNKITAPKDDKKKIDQQAATLVGKTRDDMMAIFKSHTEWKKIPEAKQRDIAAACEHIAKEVVRRSANIIAGRGFKFIPCTLAAVNVKDGLKMTLTASKSAAGRDDLIEQQGGSVTVVLTDISPYMSNRSEPEIDPDEPVLPGTDE